MTLARWPNNGFSIFGKVIEPGSADVGKSGMVEVFAGPERLQRWQQEDDIRMTGYFTHGWDFQTVKAVSLDPDWRWLQIVSPLAFSGNEHRIEYNEIYKETGSATTSFSGGPRI